MRQIAIVLVLLVSACGHDSGDIDELVGASCTSNGQCDERCYPDGNDFPGGFCSIPCDSDSDCTPDTYCIDKAGGVCMFLCPEFDCGRLGPEWVCKSRDRVGGGQISVCIGD